LQESFDDSGNLPITKTGRHGIAEILLKVALKTINKSINHLSLGLK
jgi:hypothetical protein